MGKIEKYFYWFCFFLAIYITIGFKLVPIVLKDQLVKNLDENLTQKSTIEQIKFNPFTLNTRVYNYSLGNKEKPTVSFEYLQFDLGLLQSIFELHANVEQVKLKNAFIHVHEQKDGTINLSKLLKPKKEQKPKEEKKESSDIEFLVSKLFIENSNIKFTKEKKDSTYKLTLDNINYNLYDLGTFKNISSSNNFSLDINNKSKLNILGSFSLKPFTMYGKASLSDLKIKELLDYDDKILDFSINKEATFDLALDYNLNIDKIVDLIISTQKLQINKLALNKNSTKILSLDNFDIKKLHLDLAKQTINLNDNKINALNINMIQDKSGLNFAKLVKPSKTTEPKKEDKNSKPWIINLNKTNINNSAFLFDNKTNSSKAQIKKVDISVPKLNINGSDIKASSLALKNQNVSFNDRKSRLSINTKSLNINLDTLNVKNGATSINNIKVSKSNLNLLKDNGKLKIDINKPNINISKLNINSGNIDVSAINYNSKNLNLKDRASKTDINSANQKANINSLSIKDGKINIKSSKLLTASTKVRNGSTRIDLSKLDVNSSVIAINNSLINIAKVRVKNPVLRLNNPNLKLTNNNIDLNKIKINNSNINISTAKLYKTNIYLNDSKNKTTIQSRNLQVYLNRFAMRNSNIGINSLRVVDPYTYINNKKDKTKVTISNIDLSVSKISKTSKKLKVSKATLSNPSVKVILEKNPNKSKEKKETKKASKKGDFNLDIGPIKIRNAKLKFEDQNLPIVYRTQVSKLSGNISRFKTTNNSPSTLALDGVINKYGTANISGKLDPHDIKFLTDVKLLFNNIDMSNFTPYSGKFIGRQIQDGKLDLDLKYNISKSNLDGDNNIVITKLKLGDKIESKEAVSLPLELAIALLQDSNGVIDLSIPVTGNVDDPKFSFGSIVFKAFVNLITKAITAPFSLLGAIFGFDENEIKSVNFNYGEDKVTAVQKETLDKIAKILEKRQNIAIKFSPTYNKAKDTLALKTMKFNKIMKNELKEDIHNQEEYLEVLEDIYDDLDQSVRKLKKRYTSNKKLDVKNYKKFLEEFIINKQKVSVENLNQLALNRSKNMQEYLINEKKINKKQITNTNKILTKVSTDKNLKLDLKIDKIK